VHFDNATPHPPAALDGHFQLYHTGDAPRYSQDISPSGNFRFSNLKAKLKGEELETIEELESRGAPSPVHVPHNARRL
jgi:hypothetical protein